MSDNRGIFGLEDFYDRQVSNTITNILDPFIYDKSPVGTDFGYVIAGGPSPSSYSTIDRIDYGNDTAQASPKGPINTPRNRLGATSSITHGYIGGGSTGGGVAVSNVDRIDYGNDTATTSPKGPMAGTAYWRQATGNTNFGYFGSGYGIGYGSETVVERIDYSNDTAQATPKGNLRVPGHWAGAATGNVDFGYFGGGAMPSAGSNIDRIDYANDTAVALARGPLTPGRQNQSTKMSAAGSSFFGYWMGAQNGPATLIDRLDYANDTNQAVTKGGIASPDRYAGSATSSNTGGYFAGGRPGPASSRVDRIDYSNDTTPASAKGALSVARSYLTATSSRINGFPTVSGDPIQGTPIVSGPSSGYAYYAGGSASGGSPTPIYGGTSTIDRVDFANDTATAPVRCVMSLRREYSSSGSSDNYGYIWGGLRPSYFQPDPRNLSSIERLDYASDTTNTAPRSKMPYTSYSGGVMGSTSYGYYAGGSNHSDPSAPVLISNIQRLDYASDTTDTVTRSYITASPSYNSFVEGASNTNFGYITGRGSPRNSIVTRLDFANDTNNTVQKGFMASDASTRVAAANADYGWFGSGSSSTLSYLIMQKRVERVDFSNDTAIASVRGDLSSPAYGTGASGNASFGYWGGGYDTSVVRRVDYSNDTATGLRKGSLSRGNPAVGTGQQSYFLSAFGSQEEGRQTSVKPPRKRFIDLAPEVLSPNVGPAFGYALGGRAPAPSTPANNLSTVDRIDYSNDTATAVTKGPLSAARYNNLGRHGTKDYGYLTGGALYSYDPSNYSNHVLSTTDRLDYANDTQQLVVKGSMVTKAEQGGTTLNPSYAWVAGGDTSGYGPFNNQTSVIQRFDYGSDTSNTVVRATLPYPMYGNSGTSSPSYGYYLGGHFQYPPSPAAYYSTTFRLDFSNDTGGVSPKGTMNQPQSYPSGQFNTASAAVTGTTEFGYVHGGSDGNYFSSTQRLDYSNDTAGTVVRGQTLQSTRTFTSGTGSPTSGYVMGGGFYKSYVERVDYANDTSVLGYKGPLTQAKIRVAGVSAQHFGLPSAAVEAPFQPPFPIPTEAPNTSTAYADFAYLVGGFKNPADIYAGRTDAHRYDFSNDTTNMTVRATGSPSPGFRRGAGSGNANAGYHDGMNNGSANVFKIDYANDTANLVQKANHTWSPSHKDSTSATSNANYGYYGGNNWPTSTPRYPSSVDRYDFANDSFVSITPIQRFTNATAIGNQDYGYFGGGRMYDAPGSNAIPAVSNVTRIDYASDSELPRLKGNLATAFSNAGGNAAAGNKNYGYFGGGNDGSTPNISLVQRIEYANDMVAATPKGPLVVGVFRTGASSNLNYGYFFGGGTPATPADQVGGLTTIHRITFANDTAVSSPRADIANPLQQFSNSNASNYGLS